MKLRVEEIPALDIADRPKTVQLLERVESFPIACMNWAEHFPYCPQTEVRMAHNGRELFVHFRVDETRTAALQKEDNKQVCEDSCVEFFLAPDETGYYNFEFSCIGTLMLGFRKERPHAVLATPEVLQQVKRIPSLGNACFTEKSLDAPWELLAMIPAKALFRHQFTTWKGICARANLYKCGDRLSTRHYITFAPINTPKPDFHRPEHFVPIEFL